MNHVLNFSGGRYSIEKKTHGTFHFLEGGGTMSTMGSIFFRQALPAFSGEQSTTRNSS